MNPDQLTLQVAPVIVGLLQVGLKPGIRRGCEHLSRFQRKVGLRSLHNGSGNLRDRTDVAAAPAPAKHKKNNRRRRQQQGHL